MPGSFFDTNVIIYTASADPLKSAKARQLIACGGAVSVQVLNEIANVTRRKMQKPWVEIQEFLATLRGLLVVHPMTAEVHETGLALAERYNFSVFDSMIAASALHAGCDTLWSEDMQHGMVLEEGLRIVNPFRA